MRNRSITVGVFVALLLLLSICQADAGSEPVYLIRITGAISPGNADFLGSAIHKANAEGEFQAADRLAAAAKIVDQYPTAIQLRYLQTMREMSAEQNTTTIFPLPLDLFRPFLKLVDKGNKGVISIDTLGGMGLLKQFFAEDGDRFGGVSVAPMIGVLSVNS